MTNKYDSTALTKHDQISSIKDIWENIYDSDKSASAAQHPAYFNANLAMNTGNHSPLIICVYSNGKLVGLWPQIVTRTRGGRVSACPGAGGREEYDGMLLAPSADRTEAAQAAVRELSKHVDSIDARNLDPEGSLAAAISKLSLFSTKSSVDTFVVDLAKVENWADWLNSKSKNFRQTLGGQRRNISKLGKLELVEDNFDIISWIFNEKRAWLLRFNKESEWIENSEMGEGFFSKLHRQPGNPLKLFALRLDGIYIAAALCLVSHKSLEYFVTTYSMAGTWDRFSPGMLVSEDCARWACENGLDLDFRALDVPYKHRWASSTKSRVTISAAFSPMGVLRLWIQTLKVNVRRRLESIKRE